MENIEFNYKNIMKKSTKPYDKFFTMSLAIGNTSIGFSTMGLPGVFVGLAATAGIVMTDKYLLDSKLSETRLHTIFPRKPKV